MPADRAAPQPVSAQHRVVETAKQFLSSFKTPGLILVAISGGSDSKGLLLALHAAISTGGFSAFRLAACTIDHALRPESADEARAVAAFCSGLAIPHVPRRWDGEKPATGIQAAARLARYGLLADVAQEMDAQCVVTGHTLDDQAETIAMRQSRSEPDAPGLAGMADGMLVDRRIWVLRPFLGLRRGEIRDYLLSLNENWFDDPSNSNRSFERVRVRQDMGADIVPSQSSRAGTMRYQSGTRVAELLARHVPGFYGLAVRIDPALVEAIGDPDGRRAILSIAAVIGGRSHPAGRETAGRVAAFLAAGQDGRMTAGRVVFNRRRSGLYLYREGRGLPVVTMPAPSKAIWDSRFLVSNSSPEPLTVRAGADPVLLRTGPIAAGLPDAIIKRAAASAPDFLGDAPQGVSIEPVIGLYDTFLPRFDLIMADSIAALFGRDRYVAPPVHDV
ncbi:MAG TPA: tRNA lysidine(34) synthetase TilS [Pararhizobium sp.]|uniref:tRNA lysidine(34) synthetase TilS n=1 Tax=Pararhizobium sp. TaxID=1977563 RepID=UPI002B71566E|nr:tRNA lysidine(34) synthetase TilS [Pararhizobium sp.]HTO29582.1 tRNA lysidine(34) synthetase TilS [Pararhizobium sp.]